MTCPLCDREPRTRLHYEDESWWVVDCETCGVPMAVYKPHMAFPPVDVLDEGRSLLSSLWPHLRADEQRRSVPDHFHLHAR